MSNYQHTELAAGRWATMTLASSAAFMKFLPIAITVIIFTKPTP